MNGNQCIIYPYNPGSKFLLTWNAFSSLIFLEGPKTNHAGMFIDLAKLLKTLSKGQITTICNILRGKMEMVQISITVRNNILVHVVLFKTKKKLAKNITFISSHNYIKLSLNKTIKMKHFPLLMTVSTTVADEPFPTVFCT